VSLNADSTSASDSSYNIEVGAQNAYDIRLEMDDDIAFQPATPMELTLTLDGWIEESESAHLVLVFSVADTQFFSFVTDIGSFSHSQGSNNSNQANNEHSAECGASQIYPKSTLGSKRSIRSFLADDTAYSTRMDRVSDGGQWLKMYPIWQQASRFPLTFKIHNDPLQNQCIFSFYHQNTELLALNRFAGSFVADEDIDIYILSSSTSSSSSGANFHISNIKLQLGLIRDDYPTHIDNHTFVVFSTNQSNASRETPNFVRTLPGGDHDLIASTKSQSVRTVQSEQSKRQIEVWFIAILLAAICIFCLARIIMKIPLDKCGKDEVTVDEEVDSDPESTTQPMPQTPRAPQIGTHGSRAMQSSYARCGELGYEYEHRAKATPQTHGHEQRLRLPEIEEHSRSSVGVATFVSSPSLSSHRGPGQMAAHLNPQRSVDTMDTMDTISEHARTLSSVCNEVEQTNQLDIIPEHLSGHRVFDHYLYNDADDDDDDDEEEENAQDLADSQDPRMQEGASDHEEQTQYIYLTV